MDAYGEKVKILGVSTIPFLVGFVEQRQRSSFLTSEPARSKQFMFIPNPCITRALSGLLPAQIITLSSSCAIAHDELTWRQAKVYTTMLIGCTANSNLYNNLKSLKGFKARKQKAGDNTLFPRMN